jgi:hypothetical protein
MEEDKLIWLLSSSKLFSVKYFYVAMQNYGAVPFNFMWKMEIPVRVKTFMWLILKKSILTRDYFVEKRWQLY